ncbi:MAG: N-acetylglucosamine-6-phosphate deacetylase [Candidatus Riflebacteria bacterium]|nr:N-acetylglucosamine-6-phosphate deacetylase [Candidatus Riflebacteria bacterium]
MQATEQPGLTLRGRVFDRGRFLDDGWVRMERRVLTDLGTGRPPAGPQLEVPDGWIVPGFVDLHVHGGVGADFGDPDLTSAGRIARHLARRGTTSFMASLLSSPRVALLAALENLSRFQSEDDLAGSLLGVHFEGPFLNPVMRGAHPVEHLQAPSPGLARELSERVPAGLVRLFTLAPELPGAMELIRELLAAGCLVALGHSRATYEQAREAMALGARHATHLFNAMTALHHRSPGIVGAFLDDAEATVELIPDGVHVHPVMLRAVARIKGADRMIGVTDAIAVAGLPPGTHGWRGRDVTVRQGGAYLPGGTLAGSRIDLAEALRMLTSAGVELAVALRMLTETPARLAGRLSDRGTLEPGKRADVVVLGPRLEVLRTYVEGAVFEPSATNRCEDMRG